MHPSFFFNNLYAKLVAFVKAIKKRLPGVECPCEREEMSNRTVCQIRTLLFELLRVCNNLIIVTYWEIINIVEKWRRISFSAVILELCMNLLTHLQKMPFGVLQQRANRVFNVVSKNLECHETDEFEHEKLEMEQEFTALMYGIKNCAWMLPGIWYFLKTTKNIEKFMKNVKGFDSTQTPPCWKLIKQKMLPTFFL